MAHGYALVPSEECPSSELKLSRLVLHPDRTYDQHHEPVNGKIVDITGQHWSFSRRTVKLDNFRIVTKPNLRISEQGTQTSFQAVTSHPQTLAFPGSRCVYQGPK
jgi:hypothetical protein